jgi:hypothetical protein
LVVIAGREANTAAVAAVTTMSTMAKTATAMTTIGAATTVLGEDVAMRGTFWAVIVSFFVWFRSIDQSIAVENGGSWWLVAGFRFFLLGLLCLPAWCFFVWETVSHHTQWQKPWYVFWNNADWRCFGGMMLDCYFFGFVFCFSPTTMEGRV